MLGLAASVGFDKKRKERANEKMKDSTQASYTPTKHH